MASTKPSSKHVTHHATLQLLQLGVLARTTSALLRCRLNDVACHDTAQHQHGRQLGPKERAVVELASKGRRLRCRVAQARQTEDTRHGERQQRRLGHAALQHHDPDAERAECQRQQPKGHDQPHGIHEPDLRAFRTDAQSHETRLARADVVGVEIPRVSNRADDGLLGFDREIHQLRTVRDRDMAEEYKQLHPRRMPARTHV